MRIRQSSLLILISTILIACGTVNQPKNNPNIDTSNHDSQQPEPTPQVQAHPAPDLQQVNLAHFPDAGSIDFTFDAEGQVYLTYTYDDNVYLTRSSDHGQTFSDPVIASLENNALVHFLERPAVVVEPDGKVHVAWSENNYPNRMWYALSQDQGQTFSPSIPLSDVGPETVLVRLFLMPDGSLVSTWLQDSQLRFTRQAEDRSFLPAQVLDDQTCDCCNPQPLLVKDDLYIAYRNLETDADNQQFRDIYIIRSTDGGQTFSDPARVSDAPWYISACPFSGPSVTTDGENIYVTWMDGRNDTLKNFSHTDIWLAISTDGGQTFSKNQRINQSEGIYNNIPSIGRDGSGRLHVVWQASDVNHHFLYYSISEDDGQTFSAPVALLDSDTNGGLKPNYPKLVVDPSGMIYVAWLDRTGGYLASWQIVE